MQFFTTIKRISKTAVISLWRNRWLSLAATVVMILTLFTISFFTSVLLMVNSTTSMLKGKVDISVYFNNTASKDQIFAIENALLTRSDVKSVNYISKEEALNRWRERNYDNDKIRDLLSDTYNPLPASLDVKTDQPKDIENVYNFLSSNDYKPLIQEISYRKNKDLIDRLVKITSFIEYLGWSLSAIFVTVSILIIYNTIRLTIYARSNEIEIMKLVGASDWYVQGPFVLEGIAYGLLAAIISSIVLIVSLRLFLPAAGSYLGVSINALYSAGDVAGVILTEVLLGIFLGTFCSVFAVKRYLK